MENIIKGHNYELFINDFLNNLDYVEKSYLWKHIPEYVLFDYGFIKSYNDHRLNRKTDNINKLEDVGTDIIYINQNGECIIVQCKNYTNSIRIEDLSGFFFIMRKHKDKVGEIYYTNRLSRKITEEFFDDDSIKLIKKEFYSEDIINIPEFIIKPYDYQTNIINLAYDYYNNNNSGIIIMPCGTGKTLISCYIGMNYKIVIFITPLKQYAKQNIDRYNNYEIDRKTILIDSDGCRDINKINEFIQFNKILLSVTYKSCDIICEIIDKLDNVLIVFDEFHNFSHNNIYDENNSINKLINNDKHNKLYLSATPRIYELENNDDIDVNEIFGEYIYKMSFNEAITNKYISDYEIYLPIFSNEDENLEYIGNIHEDYLLKLQFLIEAIKVSSNLKVIVYVRTHQEINDFIENFNKINEYYAYDVLINKITCDNSYKQRNKILDEFNESEKISILLSVHILDEAIDIPTCNAIYMTYISSSKIKNVQRMSRAMRYKNKKVAKIFLFCKNIDESLEYFSSIKEYDVEFIKKINYLKVSDTIKTKKERELISKENMDENKIKILGIRLYRSETWYDNLEKVKKYIDENNTRPKSRDNNKEIKILGVWTGVQLRNYSKNSNIMKDEIIYNLWTDFIKDKKYKDYFDDNIIIWINNLDKLETYINYNKKLPSYSDINKNIKSLYTWLTTQNFNYKRNKEIMKNNKIYNLWNNFKNDVRYKHLFEDNITVWDATSSMKVDISV